MDIFIVRPTEIGEIDDFIAAGLRGSGGLVAERAFGVGSIRMATNDLRPKLDLVERVVDPQPPVELAERRATCGSRPSNRSPPSRCASSPAACPCAADPRAPPEPAGRARVGQRRRRGRPAMLLARRRARPRLGHRGRQRVRVHRPHRCRVPAPPRHDGVLVEPLRVPRLDQRRRRPVPELARERDGQRRRRKGASDAATAAVRADPAGHQGDRRRQPRGPGGQGRAAEPAPRRGRAPRRHRGEEARRSRG